ncbi:MULTISPECIES: NUDIX hydrolase [Spirosoma]|uniref:NUDIX domain-containing protein n=1 Tax=Spirosoma liriopis TaxID=2937440 RepID=A0ABT0HKR8_9BACT|nr:MULTISPECIES: NUDIX domain-containing protein [Spirosoma]MCK8492765.1 NUDIX domain-containing protein [Spirosoma liriopis]UHG92230.1 NUDIX domain-containing protein [Spirosoma oryzicola]
MREHVIQEEIQPDGAGFLPGLAIDCVIFGFHDNQLKILLLAYRNTDLFALPGGFIREKEDVNDAAKRTLAQRTGLHDIYLEQFYTFGNFARYDPVPLQMIMAGKDLPPDDDHWLLRRFVTVGYYALVDFTKAVPNPDLLADDCSWYDLNYLPTLMLDHQTIVQKALETLRADLDRKLIGFNLLPETFTMNDLQSLYETILGEPLHRSSFQRRMLGLDILERLEKQYSGGAHKAPYLYRFKSESEG